MLPTRKLKNAKSQQNRPIELLEVKRKSNENQDSKTVLIIGVFHGDETEGEYLINRYLKTEEKEPKNQLLIIPCLNPDGKELKTRQNSNKVDLNRNFPTKNWVLSDDKDYFGGSAPESELETRFLTEILSKYKIDCIFSLHSPYKVVNFDGPGEEIAKKIAELTGYPVQADIGYPTPGSFGTYAGIERQIPTITLELPDDETFEALWKENKESFGYFANEF